MRLTTLLLWFSALPAAAVTTDGYGPVFPADNPWNIDISLLPTHGNSTTFVTSIGSSSPLHPDFGTFYNNVPWGIPYDVVPGTQTPVSMHFVTYPTESDPGPYPFPADAPVEGGLAAPATSDRHALVIDKDHHLLYELYQAFPDLDGSWTASNGAIFDLTSNAMRPIGWTSADAAGLPVFAGLARYDEVASGAIRHALRFTVQVSQQAFLYPARHYASSNSNSALPPMGLRFRLKAGVDISAYPPQATVILTALKHYGMIVADNGGNWFLGGAPDPRWDDADINTLKRISGSDFEAIDTSSMDPSINTTPPAAVQALSGVAGDRQATLSWSANTDSDLLGYRVFSAPTASGPWSEQSDGPLLAPGFLQSGLSNGVTRWYRVTAEDLATNQSVPSIAIAITPQAGGGSGGPTASTTSGTTGGGSPSGSGAAGGTGTTVASSGSSGGGGCGISSSIAALAGLVCWWRGRRRHPDR